jgi:hypothetical protein
MSLFVSMSYVVAMSVIALATAIAAALAPGGPLPFVGFILCMYTLHLVSVHDLQRRRATSHPSETPVETGVDEPSRLEIAREREDAAKELAEARQLREEAEQQWKLLRDMVQERMGRKGVDPSARPTGKEAAHSLGSRVENSASPAAADEEWHAPSRTRGQVGDDGNGRGYGRW